jgi:hypothetical protein
MDATVRAVVEQGARALLRESGFVRPGGGCLWRRQRRALGMTDFVRLVAEPREPGQWFLVATSWQACIGIEFNFVGTFLTVVDAWHGDPGDAAVAVARTLQTVVLAALWVEPSVPVLSAEALELENAHQYERAANLYSLVGDDAAHDRVTEEQAREARAQWDTEDAPF